MTVFFLSGSSLREGSFLGDPHGFLLVTNWVPQNADSEIDFCICGMWMTGCSGNPHLCPGEKGPRVTSLSWPNGQTACQVGPTSLACPICGSPWGGFLTLGSWWHLSASAAGSPALKGNVQGCVSTATHLPLRLCGRSQPQTSSSGQLL